MGSVICFNDGKDREVLVLDARYRATSVFSGSSVDTSLPNYSTDTNIDGRYYLFSGETSDTPISRFEYITDAEINRLWSNMIDANTAKYNCDVWVKQATVPNVVRYCRTLSVDIDGVSYQCDLPNIQTLMRIYCEAENIDSLDPTVINRPDQAR